MDKPTYTVIAARFTQSTFAGCQSVIEDLIKRAPDKIANPEFGIYVVKAEGAAFWLLSDLCQYLHSASVKFVRVETATPLSGYLSEAGQKALRDMGVEFWNKDE